jgi:hypothetical protein
MISQDYRTALVARKRNSQTHLIQDPIDDRFHTQDSDRRPVRDDN